MKTPIVFLGPQSATFSYEAYGILADMYGAPQYSHETSEIVLVERNEDVVPKLIKCGGGYGVIAMETKAQGRIDPPVNSFIELLNQGNSLELLSVIGAVRMRLHFVLMARKDVDVKTVTHVVAHPRALGACRKNIEQLGLTMIESSSNGKAAQDVASKDCLAHAAAIAPISAAEKCGLTPLWRGFEDEKAETTFFLLGPQGRQPSQGTNYRSLIVFKSEHAPGSLVSVLSPFGDAKINLIHVHSLYIGGEYGFAIECELKRSELQLYDHALKLARQSTLKFVAFGPFPIRSL